MVKVIKNPGEHEKVLEEIDRLMDLDPLPGTPEADQLEVLFALVEKYEKERFPIDLPDPVSAIKFRMEEQGLKQADLVPYIGSRSKVSEVLSGKRALSIQMIKNLHNKLGIPAEVLIGKKQDIQENTLAEDREDYQRSRIDLDEYDVEDKKKLKKFLEKRAEWVSWFDLKMPNSMAKQMHELIWNDALFRSMNELLRWKEEGGQDIVINSELWGLISQGYVFFQSVGIRCLVDSGKDSVWSLTKLINDIEAWAGYVTRENYVCYDGIKFEPEENSHLNEMICNSRHKGFDKICEGSPKGTRSEKFDQKIILKLKEELRQCNEIKGFVDQYIAHKQKNPSQSVVSGITLDHISECHFELIKVVSFVDGLFLAENSFQPFPAPNFDVFKGFDKAWVDDTEMRKLNEFLLFHGEKLNQIEPV